MVTQTFYNLSQEKRERVLNAILKEIRGKDFNDISINQIVKNAKISRGSFYQYFEYKWDIFDAILDDFRIELFGVCKNALAVTGGDLLAAAELVFEHVVSVSANKKYASAFKTAFCFTANNDYFVRAGCEANEPAVKEIKRLINKDLLNIEEDSDVDCMLEILGAAMGKSLFQVFVLEIDVGEIKSRLNKMLLLMKNGFYRR